MKCQACGNENAIQLKIRVIKGETVELCDKCGNLPQVNVTDAYCPPHGYYDENLADKEHPKGQWIKSKEHKAQLLKKLNLREAGDDINPELGKKMPFIRDPEKRRRFCLENFGGMG